MPTGASGHRWSSFFFARGPHALTPSQLQTRATPGVSFCNPGLHWPPITTLGCINHWSCWRLPLLHRQLLTTAYLVVHVLCTHTPPDTLCCAQRQPQAHSAPPFSTRTGPIAMFWVFRRARCSVSPSAVGRKWRDEPHDLRIAAGFVPAVAVRAAVWSVSSLARSAGAR